MYVVARRRENKSVIRGASVVAKEGVQAGVCRKGKRDVGPGP